MTLAGHTVLYGGSFNPPHMGHQMACLYLLEARQAQEVWLLPAVVHPFGKELAPFEDRLEMCRLLAAPFGGRVVVSDVERQVNDGRTYITVEHMMREEPQRRFALAVGADILLETAKWHRWNDLVQLVPVEVLGRGGFASQALLDLPEVSSTGLRERLARGESVEGLVPRAISIYIAQHQLYR